MSFKPTLIFSVPFLFLFLMGKFFEYIFVFSNSFKLCHIWCLAFPLTVMAVLALPPILFLSDIGKWCPWTPSLYFERPGIPTFQSIVNGFIRGSFVMIHGSKNVFAVILYPSENTSFEAVNNFEGTVVGAVG